MSRPVGLVLSVLFRIGVAFRRACGGELAGMRFPCHEPADAGNKKITKCEIWPLGRVDNRFLCDKIRGSLGQPRDNDFCSLTSEQCERCRENVGCGEAT
mgnify:CR=1 FL=1